MKALILFCYFVHVTIFNELSLLQMKNQKKSCFYCLVLAFYKLAASTIIVFLDKQRKQLEVFPVYKKQMFCLKK